MSDLVTPRGVLGVWTLKFAGLEGGWVGVVC